MENKKLSYEKLYLTKQKESGTLVSIIVPIYNVGEYLEKCINSIIAQSYQNIEIILVDDGSTDDCGKICDEYALTDKRVIVIHQNNYGLSAARNAGLDICKGEYISFIDGDDWIDSDFIELLLANADNQTIAVCGYVRHIGNTKVFFCNKLEGIYTPMEIISLYCTARHQYLINVSVWNKIYPRNVFESLRFPIGMNSEDLYAFVEIIMQVNFICLISSCSYHYCVRNCSISQIKNKKNAYDHLNATIHFLENLKDIPELYVKARPLLLYSVFMMYKQYIMCSYDLDIIEQKKLRQLVLDNTRYVRFGTMLWLKCILFSYSKPLLKYCFLLREWWIDHNFGY